MTKKQDTDRIPDRVLDGRIEERLFSCKVVWDDDEPYRVDEDHTTGINLEQEVPRYSQTISDAWKIVDLLRGKCMTVQVNLAPEDVTVVLFSKEGDELSRATSTITPRALAEAIAKADF
jgi:hypothetical protein